MLDSVGLKKVEDKNKQFLIEKIIHGVEFENLYQSNPEKKPGMMETTESNYKVTRRVYQYLYYDIAELFFDYIKSFDSFEQQDIDEDMRINGWGSVEKISEVQDSMRMLNLFQDFYTATGRLPTFNGLLVVPDGDAQPGENEVNVKQLYDLFKNTSSHGLVSLPFLGLLLHFFESSQDLKFIKNATTELYKNLSYMSLSGARNFKFDAVSDFIAHLSFIIKRNTIENNKRIQIEEEMLAKKINDGRLFEPKISDPLEDVTEIIDKPEPKHKKTTFPYVEPTVQLPDEIEETQKRVDDDFTDLLSKINKVNDVATEQKNKKM